MATCPELPHNVTGSQTSRTDDMNLIKHFLAGYTENFLMAVILWPLASVVLTLPILAYLYHRDGRLRFGTGVSTYLAVLYLLGIACFTLWPLPSGDSGPGITYGIPWQLDPLRPIDDFAQRGMSSIPQIAFNVVFFMPLGFIAGRLLRWGFWRSAALGLAVSLLVEITQGTGIYGIYPYAYRTADVDDLIYNTLGAALGWLAASALARVLPPGALADEGEVTHTPGFVRRCVAFWLDILLVTLVSLVGGGAIGLVLTMLGASEGVRSHAMDLVLYAAFLWVELVAPWRHAGSTPGGAFVRMSCETREREGARRAAFYALRVVVLGAAYFFFPILWPVFALFFLFARRMPYDFV